MSGTSLYINTKPVGPPKILTLRCAGCQAKLLPEQVQGQHHKRADQRAPSGYRWCGTVTAEAG